MPESEQQARERPSQTGDKGGKHVAGGGSEGGFHGQHAWAGAGGQKTGGGNRWRVQWRWR